MFQKSQRQSYRELNQEGKDVMMISQMLKNRKSFGGHIWNESVDHNREAKWLKDLQRKINVTRQEKVDITKESLRKIFDRMPN